MRFKDKVEQDIHALAKIIVLLEGEGLEWIDAELGVQGLYLESSTGPAVCDDLEDLFSWLSGSFWSAL